MSVVALMPYPRHRPYALAMLVLFPLLLVLIARDYGPVWALVFLGAGVSIFRYPLMYYLRQLRSRVRGMREPGDGE